MYRISKSGLKKYSPDLESHMKKMFQ